MPRIKFRKSAAKAGPTLFRSDVPPLDLEDGRDAFGHKAYAVALASALLEAEAPFTFGLFGPFGLGKTTVIDELRRQLKGRAAVVVFDAWRYEGDALRRQFLRDTAAALGRQGELETAWVETNLRELDSTGATEERTSVIAFSWAQLIQIALRILPAAILIWLAWKYAPTFGGGDKKEAQRFFASVLIAAATYFVTDFSKVFYVPTETVTRGKLRPELFTHKFSDMIDDLVKSKRLIVVIDNLDRCSAERIEEIFFTLSTFLEPLSVPKNKRRIAIGKDRREKDAVFLITADDHALRRHLNAKEALASRGARRAVVGRDDTGSYADEYLRKIFKATVSMKQILADDMREYVGKELDDICTARALDEQQRATLVELVASALKSNPRRIREFGNNLELQLRVIEAREAERQIDPKISGDVLLVAKMRLLEEEWPRSHKLIYDDPRLLARWYENIETSQGGGAPDDEDARFLAFMNVARTIPDKNVRALLRLKQSSDEVRLPRSVEFHEALVEGQRALVEEIVTTDGADAKAYAARLPRIASEEIQRLYLSGARNLIEVAVAIDALRTQEESIRRLMIKAADSKALRTELRVSPIEPLFGAAGLLGDGHFNQLMEPWVALQSFYEESPERAAAVVAALVPVLPRLTRQRKEQLSSSLLDARLKEAIDVYLPLVEAEPDLLSLDFGAFAVEGLTEKLDTNGAAFRLYLAWLRRAGPSVEPQSAFVDLVVAELATNSPPGGSEFDLTAEHLEGLASAVGLMKSLSNPQNLQEACLTAFPLALAGEQGQADGLLDLANQALRWEADDAASVADQLVAAYYNHSSEALFQYANTRVEGLQGPLRRALLKQMQTVLLNTTVEKDLRLRAAETLVALDANDGQLFLGSSVPLQIDNGDWDMAEELLTRYPSQSEPHQENIASSAIKRTQAEEPISERALTFLERLLPTFSEDQRSLLLGALGQAVKGSDTTNAANALAAADRYAEAEPDFRGLRESLVRQLFDAFAQEQTPPDALPDLVAARADALDPDRRASLVAQFERWTTQPGNHQLAIAGAAAALHEPSQEERNKLVDAMINAETAAVGNVPLRLGLLQTAAGMKGREGSKAAKRFAARIGAIHAEETEENQQLLADLGDLAQSD
jgi:KAP family P-loop domain